MEGRPSAHGPCALRMLFSQGSSLNRRREDCGKHKDLQLSWQGRRGAATVLRARVIAPGESQSPGSVARSVLQRGDVAVLVGRSL